MSINSKSLPNRISNDLENFSKILTKYLLGQELPDETLEEIRGMTFLSIKALKLIQEKINA